MKKASITKETVRTLADGLRKLPKKEVLGTADVIAQLLPEIDEAEAKGYTASEIVERLAKSGLPIKEATFKSYLRDARAKKQPAIQEKKC